MTATEFEYFDFPYLYKDPSLQNYFIATGIVDEKRKRNSISETEYWLSVYDIHFYTLFRCLVEKPIPELRSIKDILIRKLTELIDTSSQNSFPIELKWMVVFTMKSSGLHQYLTSIEWSSWEYYLTEMYERYPSKKLFELVLIMNEARHIDKNRWVKLIHFIDKTDPNKLIEDNVYFGNFIGYYIEQFCWTHHNLVADLEASILGNIHHFKIQVVKKYLTIYQN